MPVENGKSQTLVVPVGNYTITELSGTGANWSWRYDNKETTGMIGATCDRFDHRWSISPTNWKVARTTIYRSDSDVWDHHTVTFDHERNNKVWLGGENHKENLFKKLLP